MKVVIDEDLPRLLADVLISLGFDVVDIRDKAVLFSGDSGFSNILRFPLGTHYGIVILRFPNELPASQINKEMKRLLRRLKTSAYKGNLIIISPGKIRIRRVQRN